MKTYRQEFSVPYRYDVHFTRDVFAPGNGTLADEFARAEGEKPHRVQVFLDSGLAEARPGLTAAVGAYFEAHADSMRLACPPETVQGGERAKNSRAAERVMESLASQRLCRHSFVVAVGGGSMLDIVGLAAALVHRGVRLIRVPTTVLSQADSGVGVKNGIDAFGMKNYAGVFAPPYGVIIDPSFFDTLPWSYWIGGVSEAFKVALVRDAEFFAYLKSHAARLRARDESVMACAVERAAVLHLRHIASAGDPFEFGRSRPLDFGHWSAHRIEILSGYEIGHGQAVSIGVALDSYYAHRKGFLTEVEFDDIVGALLACGLPIWSGVLERRNADGSWAILSGLEDFREHLGGILTVTLPSPIGGRVEVHEMDVEIVLEGISRLRQITRSMDTAAQVG